MKRILSICLLVFSISATVNAACYIKGVTFGGAKVYYTPEHPGWKDVRVDEDAGDWWFCSEEEAKEMGFRPAASRGVVDTDGVITNGDLADRAPLTHERIFKGVLTYAAPWGLQERNIFDRVSSNYYYISNYLWIDAWGTPQRVEKIFLLTRFPPNMPGNSNNQRQITTLLKNIFPEVPNIDTWVFQATQEDMEITKNSNGKSIKVQSITEVHQLTIWLRFDR